MARQNQVFPCIVHYHVSNGRTQARAHWGARFLDVMFPLVEEIVRRQNKVHSIPKVCKRNRSVFGNVMLSLDQYFPSLDQSGYY